MQNLKLISWNVNVLNLARKRRHVYHWLNKQNCYIICIQETHIKNTEDKYLINKQLEEKFFASIDKKKRGTLTYILKELNPRKVFSDDWGDMLLLSSCIRTKRS